MKVALNDLAAQQEPVLADVLAAVAQAGQEARFILGETVATFERWFAQACGASYAVGVASGTDAIELALRALGVGPGDAVVTPAFSFVAAAEAIVHTGARPVFCDINQGTLNLDADTLGEALGRARRGGLRVRAVVPVDLFGRCAPMPDVRRLADEHGAAVVEDAAQAFGALDDFGRPAGASAALGTFSFFPTKNLGAWGDGGAVVTSDGELAARVRRLRAHGATATYVHAEAGRNSRLDAIQAAVLLAKAPHVRQWQEARERIAGAYVEGLAGLPLALPRPPAAPGRHGWHTFVVRSGRRDALAAFLGDHGVETRVYYPVPLNHQPVFAALNEPVMPASEEACRTVLALPFHPALQKDAQQWVIASMKAFFST